MKILIPLFIFFYSICFSQQKNELSINGGFHTLVEANFMKADNGVIYEEAQGVNNISKQTNFYFSLTYLRVLNDFLKIGNGIVYNSIQGYNNISPFITSKIFYKKMPVNPYISGLIGLNFMNYESNKYSLGLFYELGGGIEFPITKLLYFDTKISNSFFSNIEWIKDENKPKDSKPTNSIHQKFNTINLLFGICFKM